MSQLTIVTIRLNGYSEHGPRNIQYIIYCRVFVNQRNMSIINSTPVRVIAIVGCDGSGKIDPQWQASVNELAARMPAEHIYLGNRPGELANGFPQLPLLAHLWALFCEAKRHMCTKSPSTPPGNITLWLSICFPAGGRRSFAKCCVKASKAICSSPTATRRLKCQVFALMARNWQNHGR